MARDDDLELLDASQGAHERARERKRTTRMVMDNAAVRRLQLQRQARRASATKAPAEPPSVP